jgi:glutamine amidotransferase
MISIVDYGSGNIRAIGNIYDRAKIQYQVVTTADELSKASKIILPGVGAFDETMAKLNESGLKPVLDQKVLKELTPVLGICVGMQIMANCSDEGNESGLGWIPGEVKLFDTTLLQKPKIPHLGWNSVDIVKDTGLLKGVDHEQGFYFIHSYYYKVDDSKHIMTKTFYGDNFTSSINKDNIYGTQFHPEKSHTNGMRVLTNFANL